MNRGQINIQLLAGILELPQNLPNKIMTSLKNGRNKEAQELLAELKVKARKQRRVLAKKYHPDVTGGSDEKIKRINHVVDLILKSRIILPKPRPDVVMFRYASGMSYTTGTTTSSNTYTYY